jgi:glycosyltransferase involved in cell wall biosynthesis
MTSPTISIIIPNLRSPLLGPVLAALLAQDQIEDAEILVIGQNDAVNETSYEKPVHFEHTPTPVNAAVARNIGIRLAKGEKLLFIDSDCLAEPGWVREMTAQLDSGWDVVGGGVRIESKRYWPLVYNLSMFHEFLWTQPRRGAEYLPTLNLAVKREVIERIGLLDETFARSQDLDWTMRMKAAGLRILFDPRAAILHAPLVTGFRSVWRQYFRGGFFAIQVRLKHSHGFRRAMMKQPLFWQLGSPLIALLITLKILVTTPVVWRYAHTIPAIYLTKVAWCLGAARGIKAKGMGD